MVGTLSKYSFINAKLRARISKILPDETFNRLAKATSLDAALAVLRETPFAGLEGIYSTTGDLKQAELELLKNEIELYKNAMENYHDLKEGFYKSLDFTKSEGDTDVSHNLVEELLAEGNF